MQSSRLGFQSLLEQTMIFSKSLLAFASFGLLTAASAASAQSWPIKLSVLAGVGLPSGDTGDNFNTGYIVGGAADLRAPLSAFGVRAELTYSAYDAKTGGTSASATFSDFGGNGNAVYWFSSPTPVKPYATGGVTYSHFSGTASSGNFSLSTSENDWGYNFGGGVDLPVGGLAARLDARYKSLAASGRDFNTVGLTFGIRF
jgi:hypothetical protein